MADQRLNILPSETEPKRKPIGRAARRQEAEEKFESFWSQDSNQFNPDRSAREKERIDRTWQLLKEHALIENALVADVPCGWGTLSLRLKKAGAEVHAVDIANSALKHVKEIVKTPIEIFQGCLPHTTLQEDHYDIVVSTDAISYLNADDYRLYFAELSRIVKPKGIVVCSTNIDIYSDDALQRFFELAETEFEIDHWVLSYHAYMIRLCNALSAPSKFIKASKNITYKNSEINQRKSLNRSWFKLNCSFIPSLFWHMINWIASPLLRWIKQNRQILLFLEKSCQFFSTDTGISHAIFLGKRRPLFTMPPTQAPTERKHKRQVWE